MRFIDLIGLIIISLTMWNVWSQKGFLVDSWIVLLILIAVCWQLFGSKLEKFDKTGTEFLPVGDVRYGLRGEKMPVRPIYDCRFDCYTHCYNSNI